MNIINGDYRNDAVVQSATMISRVVYFPAVAICIKLSFLFSRDLSRDISDLQLLVAGLGQYVDSAKRSPHVFVQHKVVTYSLLFCRQYVSGVNQCVVNVVNDQYSQ